MLQTSNIACYSLKKGVQLRRFGPPIDRRTTAPTPSCCSTARTGGFASFRDTLGLDMVLLYVGSVALEKVAIEAVLAKRERMPCKE